MTSTIRGKSALLLFCVALLLAASAVVMRAQSAPQDSSPAQALNFSTRMRVQTGENVGIGGFFITGSAPKHVLLRGLGPSLSVSGKLADPTLELFDSSGTRKFNDNWKEDAVQRPLIEADGLAPSDDLESAIDDVLEPGAYTVVVRGNGDTLGVALIEVYDLSRQTPSKLANISTRAFVDTGNNIVIAGFILGNNSGDDRIVVRGIGPSLGTLGVANPLPAPYLELHNSQGTLMIANNDWQDNTCQATQLSEVGLAPTDPRESGIIGALPPGAYTALLSGVDNATGVGLVEVYDVGNPPPANPVNATVTRTQAGTSNAIEKQHVVFDCLRFTGTFRINVYKPSTINHSDIGTRAALHGQTAAISFTASPDQIAAAIEAVTNDGHGSGYYAYGQFGNLEFGPGPFSYFASQGAINREPIITVDSGTATGGFTIEFGSLVGSPSPRYNTWVAGLPLVTIEVP